MDKILPNSYRIRSVSPPTKERTNGLKGIGLSQTLQNLREERRKRVLSTKTKLLAWVIFLIFFIEAGTLGLLPKQAYVIYRAVRLSDLLILGVVIYSLFNLREYHDLYKSRMMVIVKIILLYLVFQFALSAVRYEFNIIEYFFRLKMVWASLMIFPYLLLIKRGAIPYLIKIILPVAIVSNVLYIMSALTGVAFLPDVRIAEAQYAGGLKVYRVYGGTFFGEVFFLFFIFNWITNRFRMRELWLAILFLLPHILALGRQTWVSFAFTILFMLAWNMLKKRNFRVAIRQAIVMVIFAAAFIYAFINFLPGSTEITEALGERITQGQEDIQQEKGTYGSRMEKNRLLLEWWLSSTSNTLIGVGYHPLWTNAPVTQDEAKYYEAMWDVRWASVLAVYGIIGFILFAIYQIVYIYGTGKMLKQTQATNLFTFFAITVLASMLYDTLVNYSFNLLSLGYLGPSLYGSFSIAVVVYEYERLKFMHTIPAKTGIS